MVIVRENKHGDMSSNLDEADCVSHSTNTLRNGMNSIIQLTVGQTVFFSLS